MNAVRFITTPAGEELALLSRADFERLISDSDMLEYVRLYDDPKVPLAAGDDEMIPSDVVHRLLEGENSVRVWREFRGSKSRRPADSARRILRRSKRTPPR